jgi:phosphatidylinositol alpha-1,6-mannosyltransferase
MGSTRPSGRRSGELPRLLILTPDFPPQAGGIQVVAHRVAVGLQGFASTVIAPAAPGWRQFDAQSGVRTLRVHGGSALRGGRNALLNAAALAHALRERPDVVLSMHIVTSPAGAAIAMVRGAPAVQYFHAEEIGARPRLAAFAANRAAASIAVSGYTAGLVAATGAKPRALSVIGNGTDLPSDPRAPQSERPRSLPGDPRALASERPTIVTIARIEERYKGHDVMVRALALVLAKVPDAQWVVIGEGSLRPGLEALAQSYGVAGATRFLGAVSDEERDGWLARAQLLAMPSRLPAGGFAGEGFGIVYMEAGAHGKPVVAGNVGGALDAVHDGDTGLLVDPLDPLAVAEAITRLLLDPAEAKRLGDAGRVRAQARAWPLVVEQVEAVLLAQLGERRA